uniref:Trafficking protein particle complex subunit 10 n=2 Tax=Parascaris univalens TaxID=6257 RepID=A0A915BQZ4_PARUN
MDPSSALDIAPVERLLISYRGSEDVLKYCESELLPFFDQNIASWKRQGRQFPFPLHVKFMLRFVPYSPDLVIDLSKNGHHRWDQHAFLHLFFMKPSSVDEYRLGSRHEVSEWFASVSQVNGAQWLILFDSTKAREKKNRGTLLERIKSDFAKHTSRVVEIHEGSSQCMNGLQLLMQSYLLSSLDAFVSYEESYLSVLKEDYKSSDFNFIAYCEYQMEMSRLYSTLGVLEHVLAKYDELDALLSLIVDHFSKESTKPSWLCGESHIGDGCPLLTALAQCNAPPQRRSVSLIEIRSLIVAHQIIVSLRIFDERVRHLSGGSAPNAIQMKCDFAAIILRYSNHCITSICEECSAMGLKLDHGEVQCWTVAFCVEAMQFVSLLTQAAHVEHASYFACSLSTRKCAAITELGKYVESGESKALLAWFEKGVALCARSAAESNAVVEIRLILSDQQQFTHYMQKYHESSIALLKHFGWKRQSKLLGWQLANFLLSSDRVEGALPYLLKFVSGLIREGVSLLLVERTLVLVVQHLEASPNLYLKELVDFYVILSIHSAEKNDRLAYCKRLFALLERNNSTKIRHSVRSSTPYRALYISAKSIPSRITATPGDVLRIAITVTNNLPLSLENYLVRCVFRLASSSCSRQKPTGGRSPLFECSYNHADGVNRFGCIWKGEYGVLPRDSVSETDVPICSGDEPQKSIVFEEREKRGELRGGNNVLTLEAKASDVGVYMLENVDIEVAGVLYVTFAWMDIPEIERDNSRRPICFVYRKAATVSLRAVKGGYALSGVAQRLDFELSSGSEPIGDASTSLRVTSSNKASNIEFWDESTSKWLKWCHPQVGSLAVNEHRSMTVYICKALRNLTTYDEADSDVATTSDQICVEWLGKEWTFVVEFRSLISVRATTSLLEDKALLEMQMSRVRDDGWVILPQEAVLLESSIDEPQIPAKLLNTKLTPIVPKSSYRIVWVLPPRRQHSEETVEHEIRFAYRVRANGHFDPDIPEGVYDREYVYEEDIALTVQRACYELCAQLLSSQPGAVLCRVDSACDLIVSLRSLTNKVETVVIGVDADSRFWAINEKHKLLYVKESGLGQTSFSVVPKMVGFLPYPSITVYCCHHLRTSSDKSLGHIEQSMFGAHLASFIRTNGKQVHVLGAFNPSADQKSTSSDKSRRLKEAKSRLTKLFD